jgi:hypothetical protein
MQRGDDMQEAGTVTGRRRLWIRVGLWALALGQGMPAIWALIAPRSWFDNFPGGGQHWVAALPPFNEHLATDYGAAFLAISVLAAIAAVLLDRRLVAVAMACWLVAAIPHFIYHLGTLHAYPGAEGVSSQASLALTVVVPLAILAGVRRPAGRPSPAAEPTR